MELGRRTGEGAGGRARERGERGRAASWCPPYPPGDTAAWRQGGAGATCGSSPARSLQRLQEEEKENLQGAPCLKFYLYYILVQQAFSDLIEPLTHFRNI